MHARCNAVSMLSSHVSAAASRRVLPATSIHVREVVLAKLNEKSISTAFFSRTGCRGTQARQDTCRSYSRISCPSFVLPALTSYFVISSGYPLRTSCKCVVGAECPGSPFFLYFFQFSYFSWSRACIQRRCVLRICPSLFVSVRSR